MTTDARRTPWVDQRAHHRWLAAEADRLLGFAAGSRVPDGFAGLDGRGRVVPGVPLELWVTARMTYLFALADLAGRPGSAQLCRHGLAALQGPFADHEHGGWFTSIGASGPEDDRKNAYETAFVVLAAAAALIADADGAEALLREALGVLDDHFWDAAYEVSADVASRDFSVLDPYRGANVNMHLTEAYLAAADALEPTAAPDAERCRQRALAIARRLVDGQARGHGWRLPEHYDPQWRPMPEFHVDQPRHPRQPYGVTPGHLLEWSRLLLGLEHALAAQPDWLPEAAVALFDRAMGDGWDPARPGLLYTVDQQGRPRVRDRMHWVTAEGIAAAATLSRRFRDPAYDDWYRRLWDWAEDHLVDREHGGWHHEVDEGGRPATTVWDGKPDTYHALQATLAGRLPVVSSFARGIADGSLLA